MDVIDLPGYGYAKGAQYGPLVAHFVAQRKSLRLLYCLVDARTGIRPSDWNFYASLGDNGPEKAGDNDILLRLEILSKTLLRGI